jgi:hypothetical protein
MKNEENNSGDRNSGDMNSGDGNSGDMNSGDWNSGHRNSGYGNSGDRNSGDRNSGYGNSGDRNSGNWNSGNWNSGNWNSGDMNSGDWNSGNRNSGNRNSGDWNSGYGNSTNRESGIFCNVEDNVRLFNKETNLKWDCINHADYSELLLCEWIPESKMTDEEKINEVDFHTREGYLKTYDYKQAWKNFWNKTDNENKKLILDLPNFDADIFEDITGINVNNESNEMTIEELEKLTGIRNLKIKK